MMPGNEIQARHAEEMRKYMQAIKGRGRGFASMTLEKKREIASKGGRAAHAMGTAHTWTSKEAQAAGRKGGLISRRLPKQAAQVSIEKQITPLS